MAQIILKAPGQPVADFSVSGSVVSVSGVEIDCAARQKDVSGVIEIRNNYGAPAEGGDGAYLAQIFIPALDENPLDPNAIVVTLWPFAA